MPSYTDLSSADIGSLYRNNTSHPNPMFDFLTGFVPRRLRDLFVWMEYLYYNSAQIFAALKKFSEYAITDISYESTNTAQKERLKDLHDRRLQIKSVLIRCGLDRWIYGNGFVSLYQPFVRFLKCPTCAKMTNVTKVNYRFRVKGKTFGFEYQCRKCKGTVVGKIIDRRTSNPEKLHVIRWDPKQMDIDHHPLTGESVYYYSVPADIKKRVLKGNKHLLNSMPKEFLQAVVANQMFKFAPGQLYHMKVEPPAGVEQQWGFPPLTPTMKLFFYSAVLRKANEAIALDHIVPFRVLHPAQNTSAGDPIQNLNLSRMFDEVKTGLRKWRQDPLHMMTSPVPVGVTQIGGDGRALLTLGEVKEAEDSIIAALGIPREFVYGGLCCDSEELAVTTRGLVPLGTLAPTNANRTRETVVTVDTVDGPCLTTHSHNVGLKAPTTVRTQAGYTLTAASTHPLMVLQPDLSLDYKTIEELEVGDYVVRRFGAELWASEPCRLPDAPARSSRRRADLKFPEHTTPELARLLGYLTAEGSIDAERVRFTHSEQELIEDYTRCVRTVFGVEPRVYAGTTSNENQKQWWSCELWSCDLAQYLADLGFRGSSHERRIPSCVLQSPRQIVSEFVKAYYEGDGSICVKPDQSGSVVAYTVSKKLAKELQIVLQNAGVESSLYTPTTASPVYKLTVRKQLQTFSEFAGFLHKRKRQKLAALNEVESANSARVPYVREALWALKKQHPQPAWQYDKTCPPLTEEVYTATSASAALHCAQRTVLTAIADKKLIAERRGKYQHIRAEDLRTWVETHGLPVRSANGAWPRFYAQQVRLHALQNADLTLVEKHDPALAANLLRIRRGDLRFDPVVDITDGDTLIPMADLTVPGPACYTAGGIVCHNSFTGSAITLRMLENQLLTYTDELNGLLQWLTDRSCRILGWKSTKCKLTEFKLIDDVQQKQILLQLNQSTAMVSNTTIAETHDIDLQKERARREQETLDETRFQHDLDMKVKKLQMSLAQQVQNQSMMGAQGMSYDQQQIIAQADGLVEQLLGVDYGARKSMLHQLQVEDFVMYSVVIQRLEEAQKQQQRAGGM